MQLYFEQIQVNLEQVQLLINQKQEEARINCIKLERRTYFGGEENFNLEFSSPPGGEENFRWRGEVMIEVHLSTICIL